MSPEMLSLWMNSTDSFGEFIPEKSDIYSLGLSFIRVFKLWNELKI